MYTTKRHLVLLFFIWCFARFFTLFYGGNLLLLKAVYRPSVDESNNFQSNWRIKQKYNLARLIMDAAEFNQQEIKQHYDQLIAKTSIVEIVDYLEEIDHSLIRTIYINLKSSLRDNKIENVIADLDPDNARELRQEVLLAFKQYLTPTDQVKIFKKRHCEIQ